jgi:hypothetical protein
LQKIRKVKRSIQLGRFCKKFQVGLNPIVEFAYLLFVLIHLFVSLRCFILKRIFFCEIREEFEEIYFRRITRRLVQYFVQKLLQMVEQTLVVWAQTFLKLCNEMRHLFIKFISNYRTLKFSLLL